MSTKNKTEELAIHLERPMTPEEKAMAFARWQAERRALPASEVQHVNWNVRTVVSVVGATLPRVVRAAPELLSMTSLGAKAFEELRELNGALMHAQQLYARREGEDASLGERRAIVAEALELKAQLEAQVGLLETLGLAAAPAPAVGVVKTRSRRVTLEDQLTRLAGTLAGLDEALKARLMVEPSAIERALVIQDDLGHALRLGTARPARSESAKAVADERARALTLVVDRYGQLGAAVAFVRWAEGDVAELVPSLRARGARPVARRAVHAVADATDSAPATEAPKATGDAPAASAAKAPDVVAPKDVVAPSAAKGAPEAPTSDAPSGHLGA